MNAFLAQVLAFVARHWLRVGIVLLTLFLFTRKQINFSVQLGQPAAQPVYQESRGAPYSDRSVPIEVDPANTAVEAPRTARLHVLGNGSATASTSSTYLDRLHRTDEAAIQAFIRRFSNVAQTEQDRYGIPASITLANGLLYSKAGLDYGVSQANNYFSLGCTTDWQGNTVGQGNNCLRAYTNAWTSFRDHSLYITTGQFAGLKNQHRSDYRAWARGLEQLGYLGTPGLAQQLITVIEELSLTQYD
ncbi:MAG: glucosaminidase domain-containing protein [Bacteroidota bacterium]